MLEAIITNIPPSLEHELHVHLKQFKKAHEHERTGHTSTMSWSIAPAELQTPKQAESA